MGKSFGQDKATNTEADMESRPRAQKNWVCQMSYARGQDTEKQEPLVNLRVIIRETKYTMWFLGAERRISWEDGVK